jgi:hypothetical protein
VGNSFQRRQCLRTLGLDGREGKQRGLCLTGLLSVIRKSSDAAGNDALRVPVLLRRGPVAQQVEDAVDQRPLALFHRLGVESLEGLRECIRGRGCQPCIIQERDDVSDQVGLFEAANRADGELPEVRYLEAVDERLYAGRSLSTRILGADHLDARHSRCLRPRMTRRHRRAGDGETCAGEFRHAHPPAERTRLVRHRFVS